MTFLESPRDRAVLSILALGIAVVVAVSPFLSGLLGTAVLYVMWRRQFASDARAALLDEE